MAYSLRVTSWRWNYRVAPSLEDGPVHWTVVISVHSPNQKLVTGGYRSSMTKSDGHSGYSESPLMKQGGAESRLMQALEKLQHEE